MVISIFFTAVLPLALIIVVLVCVVYYLSKKTEETNFEKQMKEIRNSYFKRKIDKKTFLYIRDNLKAEDHFSEESKKMLKMLEDKKIDSDTYARMKKVLQMSYNERIVKEHEKHNGPTKLSQKDFEICLKSMMEQEYPKVKYQNPDAWQMNK